MVDAGRKRLCLESRFHKPAVNDGQARAGLRIGRRLRKARNKRTPWRKSETTRAQIEEWRPSLQIRYCAPKDPAKAQARRLVTKSAADKLRVEEQQLLNTAKRNAPAAVMQIYGSSNNLDIRTARRSMRHGTKSYLFLTGALLSDHARPAMRPQA